MLLLLTSHLSSIYVDGGWGRGYYVDGNRETGYTREGTPGICTLTGIK